MKQNSEDDRLVIEKLDEVLAGSERPFVSSSATSLARSKTGPPFGDRRSRHLGGILRAALRGGCRRGHRQGRVRDSNAATAGARQPLSRPALAARFVGAAIGPGGVCRRRQAPLAGRARHRRRPSLLAGARERLGSRALQRGRRGRCRPARLRRGDRCGVEDAGRVDHAGGGAGVLRLVSERDQAPSAQDGP